MQQPALSADSHWVWKMKDIKSKVILSVFVLHKTWGHFSWMERSVRTTSPGMRWPFPHSISGLSCVLWQDEQHVPAAREVLVLPLLGHRSRKCLDETGIGQLNLPTFSPQCFVRLCCYHWFKLEPPRLGGRRINCFLWVQRALPSPCFIELPLRFHMLGEICSVFSIKLTSVCVCLRSGMKLSMLEPYLPAQSASSQLHLDKWNLETPY